MKRIAVYGGSFNPFGRHHQQIIRWLVENSENTFDFVLVVPAAAHALKPNLPEFVHRYNMTLLGANDLVHNGCPSLPYGKEVLVTEAEMGMLRGQSAPIYTIDLLRRVKETWGRDLGKGEPEIQFAIGPDVPAEFDKWHAVDTIQSEFGFVEVPVFSMRATDLRKMIRAGTSGWEHHVPTPVVNYIRMHDLYREEA